MIDFLITNLPIAISLVVGTALVILEVFLPGFGVPGISGLILLAVGVGITIMNHGMLAALGVLIVLIAVIAIAISVSLRSASKGALDNSPLVLKNTALEDGGDNGYEDMRVLLGRVGKACTVLRPSGIGEFDGVRLNVVTEGDFLEAQSDIQIVSVEGRRIVVRQV